MDEKKGLEELQECLLLSASEDWKTRLKGEYWETKIRCRKLEEAIKEQEAQEGTPDAAHHIMRKQLDSMVSYLSCLALQAAAVDIDLQDVSFPEGTCAVLVSGGEKDVWVCSTGWNDARLLALLYALGGAAAEAKKEEVSAEEVAQGLTAALCEIIKSREEA